jgi:phage-related protein
MAGGRELRQSYANHHHRFSIEPSSHIRTARHTVGDFTEQISQRLEIAHLLNTGTLLGHDSSLMCVYIQYRDLRTRTMAAQPVTPVTGN